MPPTGAVICTDCDGYEQVLQDVLEVLGANPHKFRAQLTWLELPGLRLIEADENSERIVYLRPQAEQVVVSFPADRHSILIAGGTDLKFGSLMVHDREQGLHQRTRGSARWGCIALSLNRALAVAAAQNGHQIEHAGASRVLTPARAHLRTLLATHARVTRFVQHHYNLLASREVGRAIEEDLALAVVRCLVADSTETLHLEHVEEIDLMSRLEAVLTASGPRLATIDSLCRSLGVSSKVLRSGTARLLGMGPTPYQRLRRLTRVRKALMQAPRGTGDPERIIKAQGFGSIQAFVSEYWKTFGVLPPLPSRPDRLGQQDSV